MLPARLAVAESIRALTVLRSNTATGRATRPQAEQHGYKSDSANNAMANAVACVRQCEMLIRTSPIPS